MPDAVPLPPDLAEVPSGQGFRIGVYLEHLEEAAALWEQRPADRLNPDLAWTDLGYDEGRLEAHLDALVLGGDLALAVCRQQALAGDAGELHAALLVFCRQNRPDLVMPAVEAVDPEDGLALDALAEALAAEMPAGWEAGVWSRTADPRWLRIAAALVAARGPAGRDALRAALPGAAGPTRALVARALGRAGSPDLAALLSDADPAVRLEAGIALLRTGTPGGQAAALPAVRDDDALLPLLGLAGRPSAVAWLAGRLGDGGPAAAHALGLLGDAAAVPALVAALDGPEPDAAALALFVMTGADLRAETVVPDVPDEDERFPGETVDPDAEARGTTVVGISTDPQAWADWWMANGGRFPLGTRHRLGWPAGPASQVASLASPDVPHTLRGLIADELAVRYRLTVAFDATWGVARQRAALAEMQVWAQSHPAVPGRWYVGGQFADR